MRRKEATDGRLASAATAVGFHQQLGYRGVAWREGYVEIALDVEAKHLNLAGVLHGGVLTSLLDVAGAAAGTYCPFEGRWRVAVTLSLNTSFTHQCNGGTVRAIATCRAAGSRIFSSFCEVFDDKGTLLAMATGTFRLRTGSEGPEGIPSVAASALP